MTSLDRIDAGLRSLRIRVTLLALVVVAVVLGVAGVGVLRVQEQRLVLSVDDLLRTRAQIVATAIDGEPIAVSSAEDEAAQITSVGGAVLASSENLRGSGAIANAPGSADQDVFQDLHDLPIDDDPFRVLSRRTERDGQAIVVHVAENVDYIEDNLRILSFSLLAAWPAILLVLGALTWWLTGRTLVPVREAAEQQERFVSDASHELRSPLTRIRTRLEVDLAHPDGVDFNATAAAVLAETVRMQRLTDDLLSVASGASLSEQKRVDLGALVKTVAPSASITPDALVWGNPHDLERAVRNLIENARVHTTNRVAVSVVRAQDQVVIAVDDDGPGIDEADRIRIFDRFTRLDDARRHDGGSGLGLSIARQIIEAHDGSIEVTDSDLGGARFEVRLPAS